MAHQVLKMDKHLFNVLNKDLSKRFTVLGLRAEYLKEAGLEESVDAVELRRYLYKQVLRLKKRSLAKTVSGTSGRQAQYVLTETFQEVTVNPSVGPFARSSVTVPAASGEANVAQPGGTPNQIEELREQARQYQVEFMVTVGEAEEYQRVFRTYPSLKSALEPIYVQARERSSKLLGQVRALERVLSIYGG